MNNYSNFFSVVSYGNEFRNFHEMTSNCKVRIYCISGLLNNFFSKKMDQFTQFIVVHFFLLNIVNHAVEQDNIY